MKKNIIGILKIILSVLLITYGEKYFISSLSLIGVNTLNLTTIVKEVLVLVYYVLIFILIYYIYHDDIASDFRRFKRNIFPNILMSIVFFMVITLLISITNYLSSNLADAIQVKYIPLLNKNIFNNTFDLYFIFNFIKSILIIPFIKCIIFVLGINKLFSSRNTGILFSGLIAAIVAGINMSGSFIFILINVIPYFVLYISLAYIYRKNNTNIYYSVTSIILYTMLSNILLTKIGG